MTSVVVTEHPEYLVKYFRFPLVAFADEAALHRHHIVSMMDLPHWVQGSHRYPVEATAWMMVERAWATTVFGGLGEGEGLAVEAEAVVGELVDYFVQAAREPRSQAPLLG